MNTIKVIVNLCLNKSQEGIIMKQLFTTVRMLISLSSDYTS